MIKSRYKIINYSMFDEESWIEIFEKEAAKGWRLEKVGMFLFRFTRIEPAKLRFFIDYNPAYEDYVEMVSSLGYTFIDNYGSFSFWLSEDEQIEELQNDPVAKSAAIKNVLATPKIVFSIVMGLLLILFCDPGGITSDSVRLDIGGAILYKYLLLYSLFMISSGIALLSGAAAGMYTRVKFSRQARGIETSPIIFAVIRFLYHVSRAVVIIMIIPFLIWVSLSSKAVTLVIVLTLIGINIYLSRIYSKKLFVSSNERQRKIHSSLSLAIALIILAINVFDPFSSSQTGGTDSTGSVQKSASNEGYYHKDIFYDESCFYGDDGGDDLDQANNDSYIERLYECRNASIANAIYEYQIEQTEHDSRIPSEEELMAMTEPFDSNRDVEYKSYAAAILSMDEIESSKIDSGYGIDNSFVMIKDNRVLYVELNERYEIPELINAYF